MSKIYLNINGHTIDTSEEASFEFRLNRFVQDSQNFQVKGGEYSYPLELPFTKNNSRIFGISFSHQAINKFNRTINYRFELGINGVELLRGTCLINEVTRNSITVEFRGESIDWIQQLENINLNRLGYVNDQPTWFGGEKSGEVYKGGETINILNSYADSTQYGVRLANRHTDYICPVLLRNNTSQNDYLPFEDGEIFGLFDSGGNQVLAPLDFPDSFKTLRGLFGSRAGLTFEDFPPAVYYRNVIEKCFSEIGYNTSSSLFNEDWFNSLYITYQGDEYLWNWKTLAELQIRYNTPRLVSRTGIAIANDPEVFNQDGSGIQWYSKFRIANSDDLTQRVDNISNFNKYLVTDESNGYVVPANGKYKIRMATRMAKELNGVSIAQLDTYGGFQQPSGQKGWGETTFVILRKSQSGETLLREDPLNDVALWQRSGFQEFTSTPSDIIAYFSPFAADYWGSTTNIEVTGSPLTNFQTTPTVYSSTYFEATSATERNSYSTAHFEIEVDLLKNERVEFYAIGLVQFTLVGVDSVDNMNISLNDSADLISITYLCGNEDIDLAINLPEMPAKDFVRSFINTFNLRWSVDDKNKTVRFLTEREFFNTDIPYDITNRIDFPTIKYLPTNAPTNITIGYTNDVDDNELTEIVSECIEDIVRPTDYANKIFNDNPNIYSNNSLNLTNMFSATKFVEALSYNQVDFNTLTRTTFFTNHPITGDVFIKAILFTADAASKPNRGIFRYYVPNLQSRESTLETTLGDLNYDTNQPIRLLQYLGTGGEVYNTSNSSNEDYRIFINSPEYNRMLESDFWIRPTLSSFDLENITYASYVTPINTNQPYQSMRYDVTNGLYDKYFSDVIELLNESYIFTASAYLRNTDWNALQANTIIKFQDGLYRLLEISDYDVTGIEPCSIKMIKIV